MAASSLPASCKSASESTTSPLHLKDRQTPPPQRQTDTSPRSAPTSSTRNPISQKKRAHGRERKKTAAPAAEAASRHPYAHGPAAPHGTSWWSVDLRAQSSACIPGILFLSSRGYRTVPQPAAVDPHPSGQAWRRVFIVWRGTSRAGWDAYHVLTGWRREAADPPIHLLTYFRAARAV